MAATGKRKQDSESVLEDLKAQEAALAAAVAEEARRQVDCILRDAGASFDGIFKQNETHGVTMKALLHQSAANATLPEVDDCGDNSRIPTGRGRDRAEPRNLRTRIHSGDSDYGVDSDRLKCGGRQGRLDSLLMHLDNDHLPQLKDQFMSKGNALGCEDFVAMLHPHFSYIDGGDEKQISQQLAEMHEQLLQIEADQAAGAAGNVDEGAAGEEGPAAFLTEAEEAAEGFVTWGMFAKMLLGRGVVDDVVNNFDVVKILNHIELDRIKPLGDEFAKHGNELNVEQFIVTMKHQFRHIFELVSLFDLHEEERRLHEQLYNLFEMIDIGGKGTMPWDDFTAFLVDQGMTEDVVREFSVIRLSSSSTAVDGMGHQSKHIEKAFYFKHYDKVGFFEQKSRVLKLCTPELTLYREIKDFSQAPLCAEYIDKYMLLVVSCSDLTLSFYDTERLASSSASTHPLVRRIELRTAQIVLCWSEVGQVLFSADHEGRIFAWDMQLVKSGTGRSNESGTDTWKAFEKASIARQEPQMRHFDSSREGVANSTPTPRDVSGRQRGKAAVPQHSNSGNTIVMMMLELPVLAQMASCGMDRNVMIWDVYTGHWRRTLTGHAMGVQCMAFAPSAKVLVTGGFDYKIFVWNPYVGNSIHTFYGHTAPIVGIEVLGATSNQVVSADSDGTMKTWDLGTYQCLQTIVIDGITKLNAFVSIPSHKRVLAADRKFIAYDYQNMGVADQTDEVPIIKAFYHPRLKVFISGCATHLRIWDAVTGSIRCVIQHREAEITDFCVDDRGRKVFIADHRGDIYVHNSATGVFIKKLPRHAKEVSGLIYCSGDRNLISVSWDRSIVVHDEVQKTAKNFLRKASNIHDGDITCVAFSRHLGLIATGATDFVISIREYERLRTVSSLLGHKSDITALAFIEPFALLASADTAGFVAIWAVPAPSGKKYKYEDQVLTRFTNMQSLESSASVNCLDPIYEETQLGEGKCFHLFAGNEDGDVRAWDLTQLLVVAELSPCAPKADWDPCKQVETDCAHISAASKRKAMSPETPELEIAIKQQVVRQFMSWRAHHDSVRTVKVHSSPPCIVTSGFDHMVKIWTRRGEPMAVLRAYGATPWNFPVEPGIASEDVEALDEVLAKVREIESESPPSWQRNLHALSKLPLASSTLDD